MNLEISADELAFRDEVRAFLAAEYPKALRIKTERGEELDREDQMNWQRILARKGWLAGGWPEEFGGQGWSLSQRHIFKEELGRIGAVAPFSMGVVMCGPVIQKFGTPEQRERFLPPIVNAELWWCQGYSEPGAGSDLASVRTRAERFTGEDGKEYYRVNGQKTWTTFAQHADWIFCLVRTDFSAKPQQGISFLLIDMRSRGITVRAIDTLGGEREVNEVWFEDVIVPVDNRIHDENKGWTCAKYLLEHERSNLTEVARSKNSLRSVIALAKEQVTETGERLFDVPAFRRKITEAEIALMTLEYTELRGLSEMNAGRDPGPLMSMLKTRGTEIQQQVTSLMLEAAGPYGHIAYEDLVFGDNAPELGPIEARRAADRYLNTRKVSIYGGSNEIQRTIIAKHALGL
ncbi:acyl-CoA dehydrogenase family protein [Novosphingobium sp. 9U]|uniref:acyl-CoA dehydrogenase family protein n=1 Tax=Novosphingobium sp. 9U TaxID=2653158 RepID=UPI0012F1863C|nr:acyl-CoA dehydrogenase family protein [Novosphingobium sp. 9U]VWX50578.1 Pimeloyl-CoA dehydrogenase large subunit [Novosphingobium sp. 9U]